MKEKICQDKEDVAGGSVVAVVESAVVSDIPGWGTNSAAEILQDVVFSSDRHHPGLGQSR